MQKNVVVNLKCEYSKSTTTSSYKHFHQQNKSQIVLTTFQSKQQCSHVVAKRSATHFYYFQTSYITFAFSPTGNKGISQPRFSSSVSSPQFLIWSGRHELCLCRSLVLLLLNRELPEFICVRGQFLKQFDQARFSKTASEVPGEEDV